MSPNFIDKINHSYIQLIDTEKTGDSVIKSLYTSRNDVFGTFLSGGFRAKMGGKIDDTWVMNLVPVAISADQRTGGMLGGEASAFMTASLARYNITSNAYLAAIPYHQSSDTHLLTKFN